MGWGEPTTSQRLVATANLRRCADALAEAVGRHRQNPTTGRAEIMYDRLEDYEAAK